MGEKRKITTELPFHWGKSDIELYEQLVRAGFKPEQAREEVETTIRGNKRLSEFQKLSDSAQGGKVREEEWKLRD